MPPNKSLESDTRPEEDVSAGSHPARARLKRFGFLITEWRKRIPFKERVAGGLTQGLLSSAAAACAYLPTQAFGLREGFWSAITAISVTQTELGAARLTARDQASGATIGGLVGLLGTTLLQPHLAIYLAAIVSSVLICWLMGLASAGRLAAVTATIILLVPHQSTPEIMLASRLSEVGWGVIAGIAVVWMATWVRKGFR